MEGGSVYFGVPVFSYSELEEATNSFDIEKELGDGGFGTVYHGKSIQFKVAKNFSFLTIYFTIYISSKYFFYYFI